MTQQFLAGHSDDATALWLFFCPITKLSALHASHPPRSPFCHYYPQGITTNKVTLLEEAFQAFWLLSAEALHNPGAKWVHSEGGEGAMFAQQEAELSLPRVGRRCSVIGACVVYDSAHPPQHTCLLQGCALRQVSQQLRPGH